MNKTLYDKNQILSIRLSADGFSFSILDFSAKVPFLYVTVPIDPSISLTANIKQTLATDDRLKSDDFGRVYVLLDTPNWTVIPNEMYEDEQIEALYRLCHNSVAGEKILSNTVDSINSVIAFSIESVAWQLLHELWPNSHIYVSVTPIVNHLSLKTKNHFPTTNRKFFVRQSARSVDVFVFDHGIPLLLNTYQCRSVADCSYYVLNLWKQLGLNQETDELYLIGGFSSDEELLSTFRLYIKTVVIVNPLAEFNRSEAALSEGIPYDMLALLHTNS